MRNKFLAFAATSLLMALPALAADRLSAGKWQVTQVVEAGGTAMPPHTLTFCHKATDAEGPLPSQSMPGDCTMKNQKTSGNTVTWDIACSGEFSMQGSGEMTYRGDSYEGVVRMESPQGKMTTRMNGKRLGEC